ncbi:CAAX amino terminal protease [Quillaja saponaria]|uniref:CAAX amino terminal protease n=1 Tax=Quillaja saponaria TaxID=32244 RepID=A0AAD7M6B2_QUISA|nr:CAAX amino terminal protease [Quillaja saponaria]
MSTTSCCGSLSLLPNSLSLSNNSRALNRPRIQFSLTRNFSLVGSLSRSATNKWRLMCFRHENLSSEISDSDSVEEKQSEELVKPGFDETNDLNKDCVSTLQKVTDKVFGAEPWTVPWTAKTIIQVMLLWIASFWLVGSWIVPFLAYTAGFRKGSLTYRGQALYSLLTDVAEGVAGIVILRRCLAKFHPLPSDWFKFKLEGNWQFDIVVGCLMFPLVNRLSQVNLNLLPFLPSTPVTLSSVEQSIVARDPVAMALYAVVVSICAPIWEEIVFRGFLLPSFDQVHACMVFNFS